MQVCKAQQQQQQQQQQHGHIISFLIIHFYTNLLRLKLTPTVFTAEVYGEYNRTYSPVET
jgi:hypothetical protein